MVSFIRVCFMSAYFNNVIVDNRVLNENPTFKVVTEGDTFMIHLSPGERRTTGNGRNATENTRMLEAVFRPGFSRIFFSGF